MGVRAAAGPSAAGRRRSARGCSLELAGYPADAGRSGIDAVLREAEAGSASAVTALAHVGRWLGIGLGGIVNILNPRLVILGGPHARLHPLVRGPMEAELGRYALPASHALVRVVPAALGVNAPLVGAAEMAFEPLLSDPAAWFGRANHTFHLASA